METRRSFSAVVVALCVAFALLSCARQRPPQASGDPDAAASAENAAAAPDLKEKLTLDLGDGVMMKLVLIPAGEFMMGSPPSEANRSSDEGPQHRVRITKPFYMGACEVTNAQYGQFLRDSGYDGSGDANSDYLRHHRDWGESAPTAAEYPIVAVSWKNAQAFCRWLSRKAGMAVRLPTEAEWEYACRAGTTTPYSWGSDWEETKSTAENDVGSAEGCGVPYQKPRGLTVDSTAPVCIFLANPWGLYDMHGNVWEWCSDWYGEDYYGQLVAGSADGSPSADPKGPANGTNRVIRGGSSLIVPQSCRSATRSNADPMDAHPTLGFRVAASPRP